MMNTDNKLCEYINTKYKCKKNGIFNIKNKSLCNNHCIMIYTKYAINIQRRYIGFRTRKKLTALFINLPSDIQKIILYYINEPVYYNKYCNKLNNVIRNKCTKLFTFRNNNEKLKISYITDCYNIYHKYKIITYLFYN